MRALLRILLLGAGLVSLAAPAAERLADPTRPMGFAARSAPARAGAPPAPVLQSTRVSPAYKSAVISGVRVREGDRFRGAVVTDISAYEVRLRRDGRETILRLHPRLPKE